MRQKFAILLLLVYVSLLGGTKISLHYCGDNLTAFSLYSIDTVKDDCCHPDDGCKEHQHIEKSSCCNDETVLLASDVTTKIETYQLSMTTLFLSNKVFKSDFIPVVLDVKSNTTNAPPILQGRAIYELTSSFTFYG